MAERELTYLSPCGLLGYGYPAESLERGLAAGPAFIGVDAGSTDPGPYYLGSGQSFVKPMQARLDLEPLLAAARGAKVPLIVGTAGGSGARPHLDQFLQTLRDIAARLDLHFRLAAIPADVEPKVVLAAIEDGRVRPLGHERELTADAVGRCTHLVGQMGTGPIIQALEGGADVVVAGRCCDTAVFAALPIHRGFDPALALHAGKIAECGTLCATPGGANDCLLVTLGEDHFDVWPASPAKRCTPRTVAAHSLYEQPDPYAFWEPEGQVDLSQCTFHQQTERSVRVAGTRLLPTDGETVKLEGAAPVGYRSVTFAGIRDPAAIRSLDAIEEHVRQSVARQVQGTVGSDAFELRFRRYGWDAVLGDLEPQGARPAEVGLLIEAVAATQDVADTVLSLARSTALHCPFPGRKTTAGNLAFPFSPSDLSAGPVYEFAAYHLMEPTGEEGLFPVQLEEV